MLKLGPEDYSDWTSCSSSVYIRDLNDALQKQVISELSKDQKKAHDAGFDIRIGHSLCVEEYEVKK